MDTTIIDIASARPLRGRWLTEETGRLVLSWERNADELPGNVPAIDVDRAA